MTDKTKTNNTVAEPINHSVITDLAANQDLKHSVLIVSIIVNLVVLTTWVALQVTSQYDAQIASVLFTR
jgi:hypothetical protein